jgi:hypothetical protein
MGSEMCFFQKFVFLRIPFYIVVAYKIRGCLKFKVIFYIVQFRLLLLIILLNCGWFFVLSPGKC